MATASRDSYRTRRFGNPLTRQAELQETSRYPAGARHHPQDEEPRDKSTVAGGLGLSMIVEKHLLDYFKQRWGEEIR
jgi:hypothetical protein